MSAKKKPKFNKSSEKQSEERSKSKSDSSKEFEKDEMKSKPKSLSKVSTEVKKAKVNAKSKESKPVEKNEMPAPPVRKGRSLSRGEVLLSQGVISSHPVAERFRMLRAKIERFNARGDNYRVIAVTSSVPEEGKSVVSVNLSRALSMNSLGKTILIDCDMRRPTVHSFFGLDRGPGLSDVLYKRLPLRECLYPASKVLDVLPAGGEVEDATHALDLPDFRRLIEGLKNEYRYIIVDSPPVLLCPEPITISQLVDSTLLVVRGWNTAKNLVHDSISALGRDKLLGIILNEGEDVVQSYANYGYYGYGEKKAEENRRKGYFSKSK